MRNLNNFDTSILTWKQYFTVEIDRSSLKKPKEKDKGRVES